ncbi:hypothetical protein L083_4675 [Actinoplanes sp. N902-109]|nr:hypothetical protein L083_4675 [Actinoplanes sp. N902-109]
MKRRTASEATGSLSRRLATEAGRVSYRDYLDPLPSMAAPAAASDRKSAGQQG